MVGNVRTINNDLFVRRCVCCGYDGALLKKGQAERCARCGCDLFIRPARSYAEMEGFVGPTTTLDSPPPDHSPLTALQHWTMFGLVVVIGVVCTFYLASTVMP